MSELGEEIGGEGSPRSGEDAHRPVVVVIQDKKLNFEEASKCLNNLGKDESGMRYAYLKMTATDRKLTDVKIILNFRHLLSVEVSGNYLNLSALQVLAGMPFLIQLLAQRNLAEGANLTPMPYLQDLALSRNQITQTRNVQQPQLEYLDLNYNQIYEASFNPDDVPALRELEIRGNYLYECGGSLPLSLEKLYLAENRISKIIYADMVSLRNLKVLHLRNNAIRKLDGFCEELVSLEYLNLRQNRIGKVRQLRKLSCLPKLRTLIILENPASGDAGERAGEDQDDEEEEVEGEGADGVDPIRVAVLVLLPNLIRLNKVPVSFDEREAAKEGSYDIRQKIMQEESSDEELDAPTTTEYLTEQEEGAGEEEGNAAGKE